MRSDGSEEHVTIGKGSRGARLMLPPHEKPPRKACSKATSALFCGPVGWEPVPTGSSLTNWEELFGRGDGGHSPGQPIFGHLRTLEVMLDIQSAGNQAGTLSWGSWVLSGEQIPRVLVF